ncbi:hypothetical protein PR048_001117 [Dryococelus australis]|uniref:Uncharacterized protein n=1 Tax=Dryococelus australis TaxID=614101 RepID=A0ABQ9IHT2_9NEOP|nr:hypothetical protein PR048_001117 [Dryococelus australis]
MAEKRVNACKPKHDTFAKVINPCAALSFKRFAKICHYVPITYYTKFMDGNFLQGSFCDHEISLTRFPDIY